MTLSNINAGDVIQFVVRVQNSGAGQPIQNVILKVTEVAATYIRGINALRTLENDVGEHAFRTYRIDNIVQDTVWKKVA